MYNEKEPDALGALASLVEERYGGSLLPLVKTLDQVVFMLHFVPSGEPFEDIEKQRICSTLHEVKERLLEGCCTA